MKLRFIIGIAATAVSASLLISNKAYAQADQLITQLASQVGVSEQQVAGGVGALMKYAEQTLDKEQFAEISDALPGLTDLLKSAPDVDEESSTAAQLSSLLGEGDTANKAKKLANLRDSLDKLGLSTEQIAKFIPVVIDYAKSKGGDSIAGLLKQALSTI